MSRSRTRGLLYAFSGAALDAEQVALRVSHRHPTRAIRLAMILVLGSTDTLQPLHLPITSPVSGHDIEMNTALGSPIFPSTPYRKNRTFLPQALRVTFRNQEPIARGGCPTCLWRVPHLGAVFRFQGCGTRLRSTPNVILLSVTFRGGGGVSIMGLSSCGPGPRPASAFRGAPRCSSGVRRGGCWPCSGGRWRA
jgi:hypothetical protein